MPQDKTRKPLADFVRPQKLSDFSGQEKLLEKNGFLRRAIESDSVPSMIFWGPPGTGKTTLAHVIAKETAAHFESLSAVSSGKKKLFEIIETAKSRRREGTKTILFIDEIHRWTKVQQDALLPYVEDGTITLIGATTENPSFEVVGALISRSRVLVLEKLQEKDLEKILERAMNFLPKKITTQKGTFSLISHLANGDARTALNILEACSDLDQKITEKTVRQVVQKKYLFYDKSGEEHYNIISALHKSMRGGDENAALYWLSRMIEGGEDPLYIARRLVRFASEDIGLANNTALLLANAVFDACHKLGLPECEVHLAQCVVYLSRSKKDVSVYLGYGKAKKDVEKFGNLPVPLHLRNAPTKLMKDLNYGKNYKYTPLEDSSEQTYLPDELAGKKYI